MVLDIIAGWSSALKRHGTTPLRRISVYFNDLLDYRETSDYKYDVGVSQEDAEDAIDKAVRILSRIQTLRPHHYTSIANWI